MTKLLRDTFERTQSKEQSKLWKQAGQNTGVTPGVPQGSILNSVVCHTLTEAVETEKTSTSSPDLSPQSATSGVAILAPLSQNLLEVQDTDFCKEGMDLFCLRPQTYHPLFIASVPLILWKPEHV